MEPTVGSMNPEITSQERYGVALLRMTGHFSRSRCPAPAMHLHARVQIRKRDQPVP
jgi:hypothetical protein